MSIKYSGKGYLLSWNSEDEEWVDDPDVFESKYIKWDEGYETQEGKIDIAPNGGIGRLMFAEANPYNQEYWFYYVDGKARNHRVLNGRIQATLQLEGEYQKDGVNSGMQPVKYVVEFSYGSRSLTGISITKDV